MPTVSGTILLDASGNRVLDGSGLVRVSTGTSDNCGCCTTCIPDPGPARLEPLYLRNTDDPVTYVYPDHADYSGAAGPSYKRCHRLFVWERRTVTSNVYGGADAADWILKTNAHARRHLGAGVGGPFETVPGSGIDLDTEPYWWASCSMGGWETVASMWYEPTLTQMQALKSASIPDGTYSLIACVRYKHTNNAAGTVIVGETDGMVLVGFFKHQKH